MRGQAADASFWYSGVGTGDRLMEAKKFPIGIEDFTKMRATGFYYVSDK